MADNSSDLILDEIVGHSVDITALSRTLTQDAVNQLDRLATDLERNVLKTSPGSAVRRSTKQQRAAKLIQQSRGTISKAHGQLNLWHQGALQKIGAIDTEVARRAINSGAFNVELASVALTPQQIKSITSNVLIQGAPSKEWWSRQSGDLQRRFSDQIRQGMLQGENNNELMRRIRGTRENGFTDGIMPRTKRGTEALVRTSVITASNDARLETFRANSDVVKGIQWVSTLDTRTTLICISLEGKQWDLDLKPIGHEQPFPGPTAHWNCRSTQISVLKSYEELGAKGFKAKPDDKTIDKYFREELENQGFSAREAAGIRRNTRASMNGQVSKRMTYSQWLARQPETVQLELLGKGRHKLWKDGKLKLKDLLNANNQPLTIAQLQSRIKTRKIRPAAKKPPKPPVKPAVPTPEEKKALPPRRKKAESLVDEVLNQSKAADNAIKKLETELDGLKQKLRKTFDDITARRLPGTATIAGRAQARSKLSIVRDQYIEKQKRLNALIKNRSAKAHELLFLEKSEQLEELSIRKNIKRLGIAKNKKVIAKFDQRIETAEQFVRRLVHSEIINAANLANISITVHGGASFRAYALSSQGAVHVGFSDEATTVLHEVAHIIETRGKLFEDTIKYRASRLAPGEKAQSLRKLSGLGFRSNERAFKDRWKETGNNVYTGKKYDRAVEQSTEILTMGIERIFNDPVKFAQQDRSFFEFLLRLLQKRE